MTVLCPGGTRAGRRSARAGIDAALGAEQQQVRSPLREQTGGYDAGDLVYRALGPDRIRDRQAAYVENDVAVIGDGFLAPFRLTAQPDQLARDVRAGHRYDFDRQRK